MGEVSNIESCLETAEIGRRESLDNGWITKNHNIYISNTSLFPILQNHSFATPIMLMYYKKTFQFISNFVISNRTLKP